MLKIHLLFLEFLTYYLTIRIKHPHFLCHERKPLYLTCATDKKTVLGRQCVNEISRFGCHSD